MYHWKKSISQASARWYICLNPRPHTYGDESFHTDSQQLLNKYQFLPIILIILSRICFHANFAGNVFSCRQQHTFSCRQLFFYTNSYMYIIENNVMSQASACRYICLNLRSNTRTYLFILILSSCSINTNSYIPPLSFCLPYVST